MSEQDFASLQIEFLKKENEDLEQKNERLEKLLQYYREREKDEKDGAKISKRTKVPRKVRVRRSIIMIILAFCIYGLRAFMC